MKMYILVNEDIKISKGKLAGQVGHAVGTYYYRFGQVGFSFSNPSDVRPKPWELLDTYMTNQKKIILKCPEEKLLKLIIRKTLDSLGMDKVVIRDKGLTQLKPNTLTCVNLGIFLEEDIPLWVKELKLYH